MNAMQRASLMLALAGALSMPTALLAADAAVSGSSQAEAADPMSGAMQGMRARMHEIARATDPEKRKELMAAQLKDMDAMMGDRPCAMVDDEDGMVVMGMMGTSMHGGIGGSGDMLDKRIDMLEKRMDMMLMMLRMQMDKP